MAVAGMILVENPGSWGTVFAPLTHASWNGCTLADVVFPFFVFILGAAMPFAFDRRRAAGGDTRALYVRIARRTALLIALGLVLNIAAAFPALHALRLPGVLQRIALVYLIAALIVLHTGWAVRLAVLVLLLLVHWLVLVQVPFAGTPGGLAPTHNIAGFIDTTVFGSHLLTPTGDPEGLLGTMSAIGTALLGSIAGDLLRQGGSPRLRAARLVALGVTAGGVAAVWATRLPLNKSLWTGSFAMWTGGLAAVALAASYLALDVYQRRSWARPFISLGFNPLALYFLSELVSHLFDKPWLQVSGQVLTVRSWLFWDVFRPSVPAISDEWLSLLIGLGTVALWTAVAGYLYRRNVRIQV